MSADTRSHNVSTVSAKDEDLYWRLHALSEALESSGRIDEHEHRDAYPALLEAMNALRRPANVPAPPDGFKVPTRPEVEALMKRCQRGVGGRNALDDAHSIMAECYGTLGALMLGIEILESASRQQLRQLSARRP